MTRFVFGYCVFTVFLIVDIGATDPCSSYKTINNWRRSVRNNKVDPNSCDSFLTKGWYRIRGNAGEEMPTTCPLYGFRCGTTSPIWLNGTYPTTGQTKNLTACSSNYDGDCCKNSYDIQVKKCSSFYVYKLVPTSVCPEAYCFGKELPCPSGETSVNGFSPGCKYEPCLSVNHRTLDNWRRSFGNNKSDITICDSFLVSGWYRPTSKAGNLMPTSCPKNGFRCGTIEPIWLNGTHPKTVNMTVNRTACSSNFRNGCCSQKYNIQIRNCGTFYIYNLVNPTTCPQAYCFGSEVPCQVGWMSDNGFSPGCEFDPCYTANYKLLKGQVKRSSNYTLMPDDTPIDDSALTTAWYKIESSTGNDIVASQTPVNQCGTKYPLWMRGTLPTVAEKIVDRKVCMSDRNNYCLAESNIKVKNCGRFNVYFLMQLSRNNSGYCFGTKQYVVSKDTPGKKASDIPWIVVVSILIMIIFVLLLLFIIIRTKMRKSKVDRNPQEKPPLYSPRCETNVAPINHTMDKDVKEVQKY